MCWRVLKHRLNLPAGTPTHTHARLTRTHLRSAASPPPCDFSLKVQLGKTSGIFWFLRFFFSTAICPILLTFARKPFLATPAKPLHVQVCKKNRGRRNFKEFLLTDIDRLEQIQRKGIRIENCGKEGQHGKRHEFSQNHAHQ